MSPFCADDKKYAVVDLSNRPVLIGGPPPNQDTESIILKPEVAAVIAKVGAQSLPQPEAAPEPKK